MPAQPKICPRCRTTKVDLLSCRDDGRCFCGECGDSWWGPDRIKRPLELTPPRKNQDSPDFLVVFKCELQPIQVAQFTDEDAALDYYNQIAGNWSEVFFCCVQPCLHKKAVDEHELKADKDRLRVLLEKWVKYEDTPEVAGNSFVGLLLAESKDFLKAAKTK